MSKKGGKQISLFFLFLFVLLAKNNHGTLTTPQQRQKI
jgi:hypothetical protein